MLNQVLKTKEEVMNVAVELKQDLMSVLYGSYIVEIEERDEQCNVVLSDKDNQCKIITMYPMNRILNVIKMYEQIYEKSIDWHIDAKCYLENDRIRAYPIIEFCIKVVKD